jgi:hypothetical protein
MKAVLLGVLFAVAGTSVSVAAPRESVTFTDVPSITNQGSAENATRTAALTGTYSANFLTITGTLVDRRGATWANEASILVTPPGAGSVPFVVSPFALTTYTPPVSVPEGALSIPVAPAAAAGTWNFEFFEMFDDASLPTGTFTDARDATWQTVTLTLDDGSVPAITPGSGPSVTFSNVPSDGLGGTELRTWNATATRTYAGLRVRGYVTALRGMPPVPGQVIGGQTQQAAIRITPPGGGAAVTVRPAANSPSSGFVDLFVPSVGVGAGTWGFDFYEWDGSVGNINGDQAGGPDNHWNSLVIELADVPPPTTIHDFGTIGRNADGTERLYTHSYGPVGGNNWLRFTITAAADAAGANYVDIDSNGSSGDTMMGLYDAAGSVVATDDDGGTGLNSLLTFGSTTVRPSQGAEVPRDGFDGALAAGTYFIASTPYLSGFAAPFLVTPDADVLSYVINVRTNVPSGPTPCGPSDVAGSGQQVGADGELTADDIIVFINWFVNSDTRADVGRSGQQPGGDGEFTADDIIVFINRFVSGCP